MSKRRHGEAHRLYHCLFWKEVRKLDPRKTGQMRAQTSKKDWKRQRGVTSYPFDEGPWKRCHLTVRRWESEKHKSWGIPIGGFGNHVATDGSLLGVTGKWSACGWLVVQLDHREATRLQPRCSATTDDTLMNSV